MNYTLTKYLTADFFRDNDFTKAFLELVDEVIFCCYMESQEILSQLSFETMDDEYFLSYLSFFLNGLSTYNIKNIDKIVLSEWFSLIHARGELSDIFKLLKFGGSLKSSITNSDFKLYNNADVPEDVTKIVKDGIVYAVTDTNLNLDEDFFINQQIPAGYRLGLIKTPPPVSIQSSDKVNVIIDSQRLIHCIDYGRIDFIKEKIADITFFRRRQFDQYYTFKQLFVSGHTINNLSAFHNNGTYFNGFDIETDFAEPTYIETTKNIYVGIGSKPALFVLEKGILEEPIIDFIISGTFQNAIDYVTLTAVDGYDEGLTYLNTQRNAYSLIDSSYPIDGNINYNSTVRNNYSLSDSTIPSGGAFEPVIIIDIVIDALNVIPYNVETKVLTEITDEPVLII